MIQYTYYSAATDKHPNKVGVNRITWEDNGYEDQNKWIEITREYLSVDPRTKPTGALAAVLSATPDEIAQIKKVLGI